MLDDGLPWTRDLHCRLLAGEIDDDRSGSHRTHRVGRDQHRRALPGMSAVVMTTPPHERGGDELEFTAVRVSRAPWLPTLVLRLGRAERGFDERGTETLNLLLHDGRVSNASTRHPIGARFRSHCSPATPAPITNTRAGVVSPQRHEEGKNFGSDRAAMRAPVSCDRRIDDRRRALRTGDARNGVRTGTR